MTKEHTPEEIKYRLSDLGVQIGNIAIEYIIDLEKENAELKKQLEHRNCVDCSNHGSNIKLLKAKEIIKYLCGMVRELNKPNVQLTDVDYSLSEAEQFLSEVEK